MLAIKNNLMAAGAARQLGKSYDALSKSVERLSSGLRVNSAGDDAAGLAVRELLRADVATLKQGARNARDGISMLQTAEGALAATDDILIRMKELAEQAATESYSSEQRGIMNDEFAQLIAEIDRIADNTDFNNLKLLDSTTETLKVHLGTSETIDVTGEDMTASGLGVGGSKSMATLDAWQTDSDSSTMHMSGSMTVSFSGASAQSDFTVSFSSGDYTLEQIRDAINSESRSADDYDAAEVVYEESSGMYSVKVAAEFGSADNNINDISTVSSQTWTTQAGSGSNVSIDTADSAISALTTLDDAIKVKDQYRAKLGYLMNRLEASTNVIDIQAENLESAESRISDVDVATEMSTMTRNQVLAQAGVSMLSQANSMPQMALSLLQ